MGKWPVELEEYEVRSKPLCKSGRKTIVGYLKMDNGIEEFSFDDPTLYPDRDMPTYDGGYSAEIDVLRNEDGSVYPQISIIDANKSFSVWDGKKRERNSGLKLLKMEELEGEQKERVIKVLEIFADCLPKFVDKNPDNAVFYECAEFFGIEMPKQKGE